MLLLRQKFYRMSLKTSLLYFFFAKAKETRHVLCLAIDNVKIFKKQQPKLTLNGFNCSYLPKARQHNARVFGTVSGNIISKASQLIIVSYLSEKRFSIMYICVFVFNVVEI